MSIITCHIFKRTQADHLYPSKKKSHSKFAISPS